MKSITHEFRGTAPNLTPSVEHPLTGRNALNPEWGQNLFGPHPHQSEFGAALEELESLIAISEYIVCSSSRATQKFAVSNGRRPRFCLSLAVAKRHPDDLEGRGKGKDHSFQ